MGGLQQTTRIQVKMIHTITRNGLVPLNTKRTHLTGLLSNKTNLHGDKLT